MYVVVGGLLIVFAAIGGALTKHKKELNLLDMQVVLILDAAGEISFNDILRQVTNVRAKKGRGRKAAAPRLFDPEPSAPTIMQLHHSIKRLEQRGVVARVHFGGKAKYRLKAVRAPASTATA